VSEPRDIEPRIGWFLAQDPAAPGMCAQHSWHSLGGDKGNPPPWGCSDANECVDKVKKSGRYWTSGIPPRGAWVGWTYGNNGHAAISNGDGTITTTDPSNGQPTGVEPLDFPRRWGYTGSSDYTVYSDEYSAVRFPIGGGGDDEEDDVKHVFLYLSSGGSVGRGSAIKFDHESVDEGGFHAPDMAAIEAPWSAVGTFMVECEGDGVVEFHKFDADDERTGTIGRSVGGDLTIVQDLPKGYRLRVVVAEGHITSARLKADIRER
jgi:hypothetical protein